MTTATILVLLQMVVQLLISASAPEVTPAVRENAISIANYAVVLAMDEVKKLESSPLGNSLEVSRTIQNDLPTNPTIPTITPSAPNPRFIGEPKVVRTVSNSTRWEMLVNVRFADAPFYGVTCYDSDGNLIWRTNRLPSSQNEIDTGTVLGLISNNGFDWNSTYNCTFSLQDWVKTEQSDSSYVIKNLPITKEFSFTAPPKPF